jgi:8-oxo-dGTP pyrophosphatase MutT (NUDIX family)
MPPRLRARRLLYRLAAVLLRLTRPFVPIDWGGVKCVLTDGDQVLLVRHTYGSRRWDLPGGGRHRGERSIDAARREMREELGLEIDDWRALGQLLARTERHRQTLDVYGAELSSPTLALDLGELQVAAWFALDQLPLDTATFVTPILAGAGLTPPP